MEWSVIPAGRLPEIALENARVIASGRHRGVSLPPNRY